MIHEIQPQVLAFPCFGIYADFDAEAPDTANLCLVSTKELAAQVVELLNKDPRKVVAAVVEGLEHRKTFKVRRALSERSDIVHRTFEAALEDLDVE